MTFLNILEVTVILCILRLISEIKYVERSLSHQDFSKNWQTPLFHQIQKKQLRAIELRKTSRFTFAGKKSCKRQASERGIEGI